MNVQIVQLNIDIESRQCRPITTQEAAEDPAIIMNQVLHQVICTESQKI